jgi:[ribosomal protein S5]-alanine N-acetyltransferase
LARLVLPLLTRRLALRDFLPDDLPAVRRYALDPKVLAHVLQEMRTEEDLTRHFSAVLNARAHRPRRAFELAVVVRRSGALIGTCELTRTSTGTAEIGYLLARRYWGRGYGTEIAAALRDAAFRDLGAVRLRAMIAIENEASRRVLVKAGLRWAALRRRHVHAKGRFWDCDEYELLRADWADSAAATGAAPGA